MYAAKHRDDHAPITILTVQKRLDQLLNDFLDQGIQKPYLYQSNWILIRQFLEPSQSSDWQIRSVEGKPTAKQAVPVATSGAWVLLQPDIWDQNLGRIHSN